MVSPAVNVQDVTVGSYGVKFAVTAYPPNTWTTYNNMLTKSYCVSNPATRNNPKRPNGTRPMSAWNKEWFRATVPVSAWEALPAPDNVSVFFPSTETPPVGDFFTGPGDQAGNRLRCRPPVIQLITADNVARTNVLGKVSQKKWDLGVTAGELKQTAGLVTDLASSMSHAFLDMLNSRRKARETINRFLKDVVRHGDFYQAAKNVGLKDIGLLEALRDKWMQYQFGVRPAVAELDNAAKALDDLIFNLNFDLLIKAKAGHEIRDQVVQQFNVVNAPFTTSVVFDTTVQAHYSVVYKIPIDGVSSLTTLGLDNPGAVLWELTQLSWMFDYVVGVGDWVSSFTAANGLQFIEGCQSRLWQAVSSNVEYNLKPSYKVVWGKMPSKKGISIVAGEFRREIVDPGGVFPAVVPQIKTTLGLVQMANSIFALTNIAGGRPGLR